jgi:probable selenium-dependent hydroxylase accessory protein YqeC
LFSKQFEFDLPLLVNFVGGGGKTPLILELMEEFAQQSCVMYTTTTRIHPPRPTNGLTLIGCNNEELLRCLVHRAAVPREPSVNRKLVVTSTTIAPRLLGGVAPHFAATLDRTLFPVILNEADGARSMSLKMPREGEPVLMASAGYLVPVIGLDCLMKPLGPETLFRWEMAAQRFSLRAGEILTPKLAAELLLHREGVCKHWEPPMKIIPFINKVDDEMQDALALELGRALLRNRAFPVERVVWGSLMQGRADYLTL